MPSLTSAVIRFARPRSSTAWALAVALAVALPPVSGYATTAGSVVEINAPAGGQRAPAVAWEPDPTLPGGGVYLLVWEDSRDQAMFGTDLYAARIQPDGTQVAADAGGVNILEAAVRPGNQTQPTVVFAAAASPPVHLIAWADPRNGIQDIFATRFLSSTMSAIPSAGFQVTASVNDTDAFPAVAAGGSTFLIAYQTNAGGGTGVNAQRTFTDTTLDGGPIGLSGAVSALNPAVIANGGSYVFAYETATGQARIGAIPDSGPIGPISTSTLSTSTSAQGRIQLATVGQDIIAVWQDARNADRDVYGVRLDPSTLMPRASDFAIAAERNNQLAPDIAGDGGGGLAVWQDRRNSSANAEIYGTRLDAATGQVREPRGFPLFTFGGNAFEPAVTKGPGQDYLVAAIRFGQPSRLFYRIVRDEDPAGALTAQGRTVVPADGVNTATVGFGLAQGPSGFTVVDGTLYDVNISSANPVVVEPDADPDRPGLQLSTVNGVVQVSLRSTAREMVTVSVSSVDGSSIGTTVIDFLNVVPVATDITITPTAPRSVEDLSLSYTYFDVNGDAESNTEIVWLRNDGTQPMFNNLTVVPASATTRGEVWRAFVRPGDGIERNPTRAFSSSVTVGNSPPAVIDPVVARDLNPNVPTRTGDGIILRYRFSDADRDTEQDTRIRWTDRGTPVPALDDENAIPGSMVVKGQQWQAAITPNDGFEDGPTVSTSTLTVVNTGPIANAGVNVEVLERRMVTLDGTASSDVDPQDVLQYMWTQASGRPVMLDDPASATPSFTAPSTPNDTLIQFDLVVSDGEVASPPDRVVVDVRAVTDTDNDGLDDEEEIDAGTDPMARDTDRDQLGDLEEIENMLDPLDADTDDDGLRDGQEGQACPNTCMPAPFADADMDGVINALDPDADNDGLPDGLELGVANPLPPGTGMFPFAGTDTAAGFFLADTNVGTTTDPTDPDSDDDMLLDGQEDANRNGRVDDGESDPNDPLDPGIDCVDDDVCPGDLVCVNGTCSEGSMTCDPLPSQFECCAGGCVPASTVVDAVCVMGSVRARCPVAATQCVAGTCVGMAPDVPDEGCSCAAPRPPRSPAGWLAVALVGIALTLRRRRG